MNASGTPGVAVPISYLAAILAGHTGLPSKDGVAWERAGVRASLSLLAALYRAQWAVEQAGLGPFVVTSILDREGVEDAAPNTLHPKGRAGDIRTYEDDAPSGSAFDSAKSRRMWSIIADAVGPGFDVILERDHIHVEHDPREANARSAWMGERR